MTHEDFARQCIGNLFTRGELKNMVLPISDIEASISCISSHTNTEDFVNELTKTSLGSPQVACNGY